MGLTGFEVARIDEIASRLAKSTRVADDCLIWTGRIEPSGYGRFTFVERGKKRQTSAHRAAYILAHGFVAADLVIDHLCRNRLCVRPSHLDAVPHAENVLRGMWPRGNRSELGQPQVGKAFCARGHALDDQNVYLHPKAGGGWGRECRSCKRDSRTQPSPAARAEEKRKNDHSRVHATSHRNPWTPAEIEMLRQAGCSDAELAAATGRTISAVRNRRQRMSNG